MVNIEPGDKFEDLGAKAGDRAVRVLAVEKDLDGYNEYHVIVEVNRWNPKTVGRKTWVGERTLTRGYRKLAY